MATLITVVHILSCIVLVLVVLIQSGRGAELSASFSGSSQTVFGSSAGENFFTRFTEVTAALFMLTSIALTIVGTQKTKSTMELDVANAPKAAPTSAPAATAAPAAAAPTAVPATAK